MPSFVLLCVIMLSAALLFQYALCHYSYVEGHSECHCTGCHYVECHYAECLNAVSLC
jgi:hypothetical protein